MKIDYRLPIFLAASFAIVMAATKNHKTIKDKTIDAIRCFFITISIGIIFYHSDIPLYLMPILGCFIGYYGNDWVMQHLKDMMYNIVFLISKNTIINFIELAKTLEIKEGNKDD